METKALTPQREAPATQAWEVAAKCAVAKELENSGDYEGARAALDDLWDGIGKRPRLKGLTPQDHAELLLRVGALSGWLGSSAQFSGAQEFAKDLITESIRAFEVLGISEKVAEAQTDLAICYWREGAMDEARVWFREALTRAKVPTNRLRVFINCTIVEISSNSYEAALGYLDQAASLLDQIDDVAARGRYHMQRGIVYMGMGGTENLDRALMENTAARIYFEQANHARYFARVENNTGIIFLQLHRYEEALEHLDQARRATLDLGDFGTLAQIDETRARVFLRQQLYAEAEQLAFSSASVLEKGGEQSLLAEALETQGIAMARMGRYQSALATLKRAANIAGTAGDSQASGRTLLTILEELRSFLAPNDIGTLYQEADSRLGKEINNETMNRLRACARFVIENSSGVASEGLSAGSSFEEEVHKCESRLIRRALDDARGSVTRAAKTLGLTHQGLCYIINHRHNNLLTARAPIRVRRKSIITKR